VSETNSQCFQIADKNETIPTTKLSHNCKLTEQAREQNGVRADAPHILQNIGRFI